MINIEVVCTKSPNPYFTVGNTYVATLSETSQYMDIYTVTDSDDDPMDWSAYRDGDTLKMMIGVEFKIKRGE